MAIEWNDHPLTPTATERACIRRAEVLLWPRRLNLLVRWLHIITGIAWIGASFYFVWLDNTIRPPAPGSDLAKKGVAGELWAVHGGGFYNPRSQGRSGGWPAGRRSSTSALGTARSGRLQCRQRVKGLASAASPRRSKSSRNCA